MGLIGNWFVDAVNCENLQDDLHSITQDVLSEIELQRIYEVSYQAECGLMGVWLLVELCAKETSVGYCGLIFLCVISVSLLPLL